MASSGQNKRLWSKKRYPRLYHTKIPTWYLPRRFPFGKGKALSPGWQKTRAHENDATHTCVCTIFLLQGPSLPKTPFLKSITTFRWEYGKRESENPACLRRGREDGVFVPRPRVWPWAGVALGSRPRIRALSQEAKPQGVFILRKKGKQR